MGLHKVSVYREEKQFLTYLKFLSPFFVDCDTLAYSCMIFLNCGFS